MFDGCALAIGQGLLRTSFDPSEPLGISFGPLARLEGRGCEVLEVEPGGAAERLGVRESMVIALIARTTACATDGLFNGVADGVRLPPSSPTAFLMASLMVSDCHPHHSSDGLPHRSSDCLPHQVLLILMTSDCPPHQVLLRMERPDLLGLSDLLFEDVMARIDERRSGQLGAPSRALDERRSGQLGAPSRALDERRSGQLGAPSRAPPSDSGELVLGAPSRAPPSDSGELVLGAPSRAPPSDSGELVLVFETAAPVSHLYAVELPAVPALAAFAASEGRATEWVAADADASGAVHRALSRAREVSSALTGLANYGSGAVLWKEEETKAFIGEASSMTCAHVDIAPQLEIAHGLAGLKVVGVGSHGETLRLLSEHAGACMEEEEEEEEEEGLATCVPTDRPLKTHEAALLGDPAVTLCCLHPGDALVFSSAVR